MQSRTHLSLEVSDLEKAVHFYSQLFGVAATKREPGYANFRLETPPLHLALAPGAPQAPKGHAHFGVELFATDELLAWRQRVEAAGLRPRVEEQVTCCYALADKFWLKDPDGHAWEFWVRHADTRRASDGDSACCVPGPEAGPEASSSCCGG